VYKSFEDVVRRTYQHGKNIRVGLCHHSRVQCRLRYGRQVLHARVNDDVPGPAQAELDESGPQIN